MSSDLKIILKKSIAGKQKYQLLLYKRFCHMVYGICRRYANGEDQANDMFQEAFFNIYKNLRKVKDAEALPGWVKRVTVNACLDHLKLNNKGWVDTEEVTELNDGFYSELMDRFSSEQIMTLVNNLPEGYRVVLNMYVMDGFSHKEIAERMGIGESTSRSQLTYAKRILKEQLKKFGIDRYESVI